MDLGLWRLVQCIPELIRHFFIIDAMKNMG